MVLASHIKDMSWWIKVAQLVNAASVFILVLVTTYYAYTTNGILKESKKTREAADKQAQAAEKTLAFLQAQIEEESKTALATLLGNVLELRKAAAHWSQEIVRPMPVNQTIEADLLPPEWAASLEKARRISPELFQKLQSLQRSSREVSRSIERFYAIVPAGRDSSQIREHLAKIDHECVEVLGQIAPLVSSEHVNAAFRNT